MKRYLVGVIVIFLLAACSSGAPGDVSTSAAPQPDITSQVVLTATPSSPSSARPATTEINTGDQTGQVAANPTQPTPVSPAPISEPAQPASAPATSPTAAQPQPAALPAADCLDQAVFIADASVPDGTLFRQGEAFTKSWRVQNAGTCTWDSSYSLVHVGGDIMNGQLSKPLPAVQPGEITDISIDLVAPQRGGPQKGYWSLHNPAGKDFGVGFPGGPLWAQINVAFVQGTSGTNTTSTPSGGSPSTPAQGSCAYQRNNEYINTLFSLINQARTANGLEQLNLQNQLSAAAEQHSIDMACKGFVDHKGSDGSTWYQRAEAQGYGNPASARENIYVGDPAFGGTPQGTLNWWMNSQIHRDNLLDPNATDIGLGYVYLSSSPYGGYYTAVLARSAP